MASQFPDDRPTHVTPPASGGTGLVERVKGIITSPKTEWPRIDAEPATERDLYMRYVLPLAAIPAVAGLIGQLAFPPRVFGVVVRTSPVSAVVAALVSFAMAFVAVFVIARIVDALAPTFNARKGIVPATKLVVFASVPAWVAGVFNLIPALGALAVLIASVYGLYLLYLGLPVLMKSPADKTVPYLAVTIVVAIVVMLVIGIVTGIVGAALGSLFAPTMGTVTIS